MLKDISTVGRLRVSYKIYPSPSPGSDTLVVLHHGICHSRKHFFGLIRALNRAGLHVAIIDQQVAHADLFRRTFIGLGNYVAGMKAALESIEQNTRFRIGSYAVHSMGALICEVLQRDYPHLARPTVLMTPIPVRGALPISLRLLGRYPLSYLWALLTLNILFLARTPDRTRQIFFDRSTPPRIVARTQRRLQHAPFLVYLQLVLRGLFGPRIDDYGERKLLITSPTDYIFRPIQYEPTLARYARLQHVQLDGGHDFFMHKAAPTASLIARFHQDLRQSAEPSGAVPPPHAQFAPDDQPVQDGVKPAGPRESVTALRIDPRDSRREKRSGSVTRILKRALAFLFSFGRTPPPVPTEAS